MKSLLVFVLMVFAQLVSEAAVRARHGLVAVQVDVDLGVAKGGVRATRACDDAGFDDLGRHLGDEVDGPLGVGLFPPVHEPGRADVALLIPLLACVSLLIQTSGSLKSRAHVRINNVLVLRALSDLPPICEGWRLMIGLLQRPRKAAGHATRLFG